MNLTLNVWRQKNTAATGAFATYTVSDVSPDSSFLEMLDGLNQDLILKGDDPIVFEHDCREGICGSCGVMINGLAHGGDNAATTCQLHMRSFKDGDILVLEPWRSRAFPVLRDLMVDRSAFDRIIQSGGYVSVGTGGVPDANALPIPKENADKAFEAAACIGCGACVAACPNASAMLFTSAKVGHLGLLPQGQVERDQRVLSMVAQMEEEGFGGCTNLGECSAACPKEISLDYISRMNRDLLVATLRSGK